MSATWTNIFSNKGDTLVKMEEQIEEKEERYRLFLDVQREMMEFNRERVRERLSIEREGIDMEKQEKRKNGSLKRRSH